MSNTVLVIDFLMCTIAIVTGTFLATYSTVSTLRIVGLSTAFISAINLFFVVGQLLSLVIP